MVYIKELKIKDFRLIKELSFQPSKYVNIISGKNGTGKSTILGMIAQGFSYNNKVIEFISSECQELNKTKFSKLDPELDAQLITEYNSILTHFGKPFESSSNEHFKLSEKDVRETEHINVTLDNEEYFKLKTTNHKDRILPRFVTRRDNNESANYIHPVIYLGLDRLTPLVKTRNKNFILDISEQDKEDIHILYKSILLKDYPNNLTATETNTKKQTAAYIDPERTIEMISSGEDIVGQLLLALYSFKKLKDNYPDNYKGGILLVDEVDATLYPAAQNILLDIFLEKARAWNIQIFVTTHSLTLLEHLETEKIKNPRVNRDVKIFTTSESNISDIKIIELDFLYKFKNELLAQVNQELILDKVKVYFEDSEAYFVFTNLIKGFKDSHNLAISKRIKSINGVSISSTQYQSLHKHKVPEFTKNSIICLDGDQEIDNGKYKNFITLPNHGSKVNPEEFVFDILNNPKSGFWKQTNDDYNYSIFMNNPNYRVLEFIKNGSYEEQYKKQNGTYKNTKPREVWKAWFNDEKSNWKGQNNPIVYWKNKNLDSVNEFEKSFKKAYDFVAKNNKIPGL
ncbi:AAA family ATPase [Streptococcus pneumoniae]|uniref:AAA family ATPase n=1 Tax=Streptococcus pneumoniae TaxID=1313 RepID=UPI0005DE8C62|nr:AAA family ATPase [Streptococcus pneumoniae]CEV51581.1 prophage Lp2 protein 4 [Streptococcus pneumoniae]CJF60093.1 prophage Lp2 protein 4 [Streptococcus pneumoniae]CJK68144.1 prophage Lp2 protein 4 [Streptococcus pneumoniae]CJN90275.1 prophage Lp2 protein 4 [Streptococcus pneumoniae]CJU00148.1 prophage Lp2 protein 4 [Streptococcus pneumoniae]